MLRVALQGLIRVLFVVYCIEAGLFLVLAPWREIWGTLLGYLPYQSLRVLLSEMIARGAISGFGLVHILWGIHDANEIIQGRGRRANSRDSTRGDTESPVSEVDQFAPQIAPSTGSSAAARRAEGN